MNYILFALGLHNDILVWLLRKYLDLETPQGMIVGSQLMLRIEMHFKMYLILYRKKAKALSQQQRLQFQILQISQNGQVQGIQC